VTTASLGISLPILNQPYATLPALAAAADVAGFDSIWAYEFFRNPFVIQSSCAPVTNRARLAIGLAAAVARTPFAMANSAADVDELSGGRVLLGVSMGGGGWQDQFHGADIDAPLSRLREYISLLRLAWHHLHTGEPVSFQGRFYRMRNPENPWGVRPLARPAIPVYIGCTRPNMIALAGEVADGLLGVLFTPEYVRDVVRPNIGRGAEVAGRDPAALDVASYVICSCSDDGATALRRARIQVGNYVAYAGGGAVIEHMGLQADRDAVVAALRDGGAHALEHTTSDALVQAFSIHGTPQECRDQLPRFADSISHVILHTPYVPPLTEAESWDAFHSIVSAFDRSGRATHVLT
jgi:alkanesulfonate monooxygenase SsuD/methylene tetrahydromethanopterin reductase-like flavin-dependent oxidoreductase (luciferase family)